MPADIKVGTVDLNIPGGGTGGDGKKRERRDVFRQHATAIAENFRQPARRAVTHLREFAQAFGQPDATRMAEYEKNLQEVLTARNAIEGTFGNGYSEVTRAANELASELVSASGKLDADRPISTGVIDKHRAAADRALNQFDAALLRRLESGRAERPATLWLRKRREHLMRGRRRRADQPPSRWLSAADSPEEPSIHSPSR